MNFLKFKYFTFQWWYQKKYLHFHCNTRREYFTLYKSARVQGHNKGWHMLFEIVLEVGKRKKKASFPSLITDFQNSSYQYVPGIQ